MSLVADCHQSSASIMSSVIWAHRQQSDDAAVALMIARLNAFAPFLMQVIVRYCLFRFIFIEIYSI